MNFVASLLDWFSGNARAMPWRENDCFYYVWLSEMMLQQTQVATVIPYFNRFVLQLPTLSDLAQADLQQVLKLWEGLGYYSRARYLHRAAVMIESELGGDYPKTYDSLQKLPGIGPYAGAAIASIVFNEKIPVVDGNVLRVFSRFFGYFTDIRDSQARLDIFSQLMDYIPQECPGDFNQAIMELGALVCRPKNPDCGVCPIQWNCYAFREKKVSDLPVKSKLPPIPHFDIAVGLIWKNGQLLIGKRSEKKMLGGLWEFPGGKQKKNELLKQTVLREVKEETNLDVQVGTLFCKVNHSYTHFKITMHVFHCDSFDGQLKTLSADELRWVAVSDLSSFPFPTANIRVIDQLKQLQ